MSRVREKGRKKKAKITTEVKAKGFIVPKHLRRELEAERTKVKGCDHKYPDNYENLLNKKHRRVQPICLVLQIFRKMQNYTKFTFLALIFVRHSNAALESRLPAEKLITNCYVNAEDICEKNNSIFLIHWQFTPQSFEQ